MPSFLTTEMEKANLKFIDLVKKHECIWNRDAETYNQKQEMDKAWNEIAKEMDDTSKTCLLHWQKIRRAYSRSFRLNNNGTHQKSEYYMSSALEFVRPHLKLGCTRLTDHSIKDKSSNDTDDSHTSLTEIDIKEEPNDSDGGTASTSENNVEHILFEIIKSEGEEDTENKHKIELDTAESSCNKRKSRDDSIERKKPTETNEADANVHPNTSLIEANRRFFESLIPFVDEMNTQQNRRFRREIMCLIDDVLDDRDLENNSSS